MARMETSTDQVPATARILMVDDDPGILDVVSDFLGKHGYHVDTAGDAREMELALERGWKSVVLSHARDSAKAQGEYQRECRIEVGGGIELRGPAFPSECDYVRVVDMAVAGGVELMYWSSDEWKDAPTEVMGAVLALLAQFRPAKVLQESVRTEYLALHTARQDWLDVAEFVADLDVPGGASARDSIVDAIRNRAARMDEAPSVYMRTAGPGEMALEICRTLGLHIVDDHEAQRVASAQYPRSEWARQCSSENQDLGYWEWALLEAHGERAREGRQARRNRTGERA